MLGLIVILSVPIAQLVGMHSTSNKHRVKSAKFQIHITARKNDISFVYISFTKTGYW